MRATDLASLDQYNYPELYLNYLTRYEDSTFDSTVKALSTSEPNITGGNSTLCKNGVNKRN